MGAIARRSFATGFGLVSFLLLRADHSAGVRAQISHIADALSSGDPGDAMKPFDKSFPDYGKLRGYFQALSGFQIESEIEFIDEEDTENESKVTIDWALTFTDPASNATERREGEINLRLVRQGDKWKIIAFSPITLFNPQKIERKR